MCPAPNRPPATSDGRCAACHGRIDGRPLHVRGRDFCDSDCALDAWDRTPAGRRYRSEHPLLDDTTDPEDQQS